MSETITETMLKAWVQPTIEDLGFCLWSAVPIRQGTGPHSRWLLQIGCDGPSGTGFRIADCQRVARQLQRVLDVAYPWKTPYQLEVSSPGIERPLTASWQFARCVGQTIRWKPRVPGSNPHGLQGELVAVDETRQIAEVVLETGERVSIPLSEMAHAHVALK